MSIQDDHRRRQQGAHPPAAGEPHKEMPPLPRGARQEGDRASSAAMNARSINSPAGRPAPADLSQYRAGRAQGRAGDSEHTETAAGLPLMLEAVRAVVRDELGELRRELTTQFAAGDEILTKDEAAQLLRVCSKTVVNWIHELGLPGKQIGVEWRFLRSEVIRWAGEHHVR